MKTSILVVSKELKKEAFQESFGAKYELVFAPDLLSVPKALKKRSYDIGFIHIPGLKKAELLSLKQISKGEGAFDWVIALEPEKVQGALEILGERGDYLVLPYSPAELKLKFERIVFRKSLERENHFWRVELAALLADRETLKREDIPADIWERAKEGRTKEEAQSFKRSRKEFEKQCLRQALERARGSQTEAAKALGIHRNTLIWKMKKLHLEEDYRKIVRKRRDH